MKVLSRIALVLVLTMFVSGLSAQQRGQGRMNVDPEEAAGQQLKTLMEIVKVEKKDEAKIKEIFLNSAKANAKMREEVGASGDRSQMREKMTELNKKRDEELKKVLGEKNMKKYTEEMAKRRQNRGQGRR